MTVLQMTRKRERPICEQCGKSIPSDNEVAIFIRVIGHIHCYHRECINEYQELHGGLEDLVPLLVHPKVIVDCLEVLSDGYKKQDK